MREEEERFDIENQEILSKPPHWIIIWGNSMIAAAFIIILLISYFIKYPDIILAESFITTLPYPQKILAKSNGNLDSLLVKNNDYVRPHSILAVLENPADFNDVLTLKQIIHQYKLNPEPLNFPVEKLSRLNVGSIQDYLVSFENALINYNINYQLKPLETITTSSTEKLSELKDQLVLLISHQKLIEKEVDLEKRNFLRNKKLHKKEIISDSEFEKLNISYLKASEDLKNINNSISRLRNEITNGELQKKENLNNIDIQKIKLLSEVNQNLYQLKKAIKSWEQNFLLSSDIEGKVVYHTLLNDNQNIQNGEIIFYVLPTNVKYIAKLKVSSNNSGKIKIGQNVNIKLDNYPTEEYGYLKGQITYISSIPDKEGFYHINADIPQDLKTSYGKKITMNREIIGKAEIITKDLRLIQRFYYNLKNTVI